MKKIIILLFCVLVSLSMVSCKIEFPEDNTDVFTQESTSEVVSENQTTLQTSTTNQEQISEVLNTTQSNTQQDVSKTEVSVTEKETTTKTQTTEQTITEKTTLPQTTESTTKVEDNKQYCTISINCSTILNNMDSLNSSKVSLIPSSGVILSPKKVEIKDGDTVYDVLNSVTKKYGIHMESSVTPGVNSRYIEGINNIYEFDCGPLSGWLFSVNGSVGNVSISSYEIKEGDNIKILYTCSLGEDL